VYWRKFSCTSYAQNPWVDSHNDVTKKSCYFVKTSCAKLSWLLDNEPEAYVKMALDGTMQDYLDRYEKSSNDCESGIRESLEKHYSPEIARQIAREMMMYG